MIPFMIIPSTSALPSSAWALFFLPFPFFSLFTPVAMFELHRARADSYPVLYITALFCLVLLCCTTKAGGKHFKLRFGSRWGAPKLTKCDLKLNGGALLSFSLLQPCVKIHKKKIRICKMVQNIYCSNMVLQD